MCGRAWRLGYVDLPSAMGHAAAEDVRLVKARFSARSENKLLTLYCVKV